MLMNATKKKPVRNHGVYVRLNDKLYQKATKIKETKGQSWATYMERLIEKDNALQK